MKYTVVVTDENNSYDYIARVEAADVADAKRLACAEAAEEWEVDPNAVDVRGVIAGEVNIIEWHDHPTENAA